MKRRYILEFALDAVNEPATYTLITRYDLKANILRASICPEYGGELLMELEGTEDNLNAGLAYLVEKKIVPQPIEERVRFTRERCVHCGACTGVCFPGALSMDASWKLVFDPQLCVECGLCIKACPVRCLELHY